MKAPTSFSAACPAGPRRTSGVGILPCRRFLIKENSRAADILSDAGEAGPLDFTHGAGAGPDGAGSQSRGRGEGIAAAGSAAVCFT